MATSDSAEGEKLCEVLPQFVDPLALDPRLRALLAHWESLPGPLRESLFRQFSEAVVLQSVLREIIHSI